MTRLRRAVESPDPSRRRWRRPSAAVVTGLTGAAVLAGGLLASTPAQASVPPSTVHGATVSAQSAPLPGSVKHTDGKYWAFFAPPRWIASYGAYGITVSTPNGRDTIDYGFSSVLCASASTFAGSAAAYLGNQRQQVLANSGLRRIRVQRTTFTQLPVAQYGPNYFRATTVFRGRSSGTRVKVSMVNDYSFYDTTYCFNRNLSLAVQGRRPNRKIDRLVRVEQTFAYFGPGACDPQNETSCPAPPKP